MKKIDNKAFTVIELILSFSFVMILALGMFSIVTNYRERQYEASLVKNMTTYRSRLTMAIQNDINDLVLEWAEYCTNVTGMGFNPDCIVLSFKTKETKKLEIQSGTYVDPEGSPYTARYITYGGIIYETVEPQFTTIKPEIMLERIGMPSTQIDSLTIYKINIPVYHEDLDDNYGLRIVANGYNKI